jgi:hypothetical protein
MSSEVHFVVCKDREISEIPRTLIEEAFAGLLKEKGEDVWLLIYPDGSLGELHFGSQVGETTFSIDRPPACEAFWKATFDLLQRTPSVLLWPSGESVVAHPEARDQIPASITEAMGEPTFIRSHLEILQMFQ